MKILTSFKTFLAVCLLSFGLLFLSSFAKKGNCENPTPENTINLPFINAKLKTYKTYDRCDWKGKDLSGRYLRDMNFENMDLHGVNFENSVLVNVSFKNSRLNQANFKNAKVSYSHLGLTCFDGANFDGADLRYGNYWRGANLQNASFEKTLLSVASSKELPVDTNISKCN